MLKIAVMGLAMAFLAGCAGEALQAGSSGAAPVDTVQDTPHVPSEVAVEYPKTVELHSLCNRPVYGAAGSDWFAEFELGAIPRSAESFGSGDTKLPYEGETIELGYVMVGTVARVHCAVEGGAPDFKYHGFQDVTFKAVMP
jgi:hypothetical protein